MCELQGVCNKHLGKAVLCKDWILPSAYLHALPWLECHWFHIALVKLCSYHCAALCCIACISRSSSWHHYMEMLSAFLALWEDNWSLVGSLHKGTVMGIFCVCFDNSLNKQLNKHIMQFVAWADHYHGEVIKWKYFPRDWPFVQGQWCRTLMFAFICVWANGWATNRDADDLRCHRAPSLWRHCNDGEKAVSILVSSAQHILPWWSSWQWFDRPWCPRYITVMCLLDATTHYCSYTSHSANGQWQCRMIIRRWDSTFLWNVESHLLMIITCIK